jgi:hypothetical protein
LIHQSFKIYIRGCYIRVVTEPCNTSEVAETLYTFVQQIQNLSPCCDEHQIVYIGWKMFLRYCGRPLRDQNRIRVLDERGKLCKEGKFYIQEDGKKNNRKEGNKDGEDSRKGVIFEGVAILSGMIILHVKYLAVKNVNP